MLEVQAIIIEVYQSARLLVHFNATMAQTYRLSSFLNRKATIATLDRCRSLKKKLVERLPQLDKRFLKLGLITQAPRCRCCSSGGSMQRFALVRLVRLRHEKITGQRLSGSMIILKRSRHQPSHNHGCYIPFISRSNDRSILLYH